MTFNVFSPKRFVGAKLIAASLILCGLTACKPAGRSGGNVVVSGKADIGGPFTLINQDGNNVTEADLLGRPALTYFGFTYCPDICPTALQSIGAAMATVDPKGEYFQTVLFSVDPERDTPELLKQYISAPIFPKGLQAFTGTQEQVDQAKKSYRIYAEKVEDGDASDYLIDHVSLIYLFDKNGDFVEVFTHGTSVKDLQKILHKYKRANPL